MRHRPPGGGSGGEDGGSCRPAVSFSSFARPDEAAAALRRDPELALNLPLDEPAKLLEELPQGLTTPPGTSAPGDRGASSSRSRRSPPRLSPAGPLVPEVRWSARLPAAVWAGVYAECGALARLRLRHVSSLPTDAMYLSVESAAQPLHLRTFRPRRGRSRSPRFDGQSAGGGTAMSASVRGRGRHACRASASL